LRESEYRMTYGGGQPTLGEPYPAFVKSVNRGVARLLVGSQEVSLDLTEAGWAKKILMQDDSTRFGSPADVARAGDLIEVSLRATTDQSGNVTGQKLVLDQTPDIEGAVVLIDPFSGEVRSMVGGYDYSQSQFNRVTQSLRQPGSSFKPVVYLAAIDKFNYTPATIVNDAPRMFRVGDQFWSPANFDNTFLGPITLRTALEKSRNLVSADIVSRIGVDAPIQYARQLGIASPLGRNLSLSLGSSEVTPLEMTRAYGVFDAKGVLFDSVFVTKVTDRFGKVLFDYSSEKPLRAKQAINENSAFVMANMMKGVVENGTGYKVKELGRPVAGKTGTSNDQMDAWFIGYTPSWVCGVWVGFDQKKPIGAKETGGVVSAPIWLYFMRDFLAFEKQSASTRLEQEAKEEAARLGIAYVAPTVPEQLDFAVPEGVDPFWVSRGSGGRVEEGSPGAILDYFVKGSEPEEAPLDSGGEEGEESSSSYLESPDL